MIRATFATLAAILLVGATEPPRIFIASDSTAQDYKADKAPQSGWGTMLRCWTPLAVENRAIGGRSTRSFIAEGRFDKIATDIRAGDTLLIQFGHNDADTKKMAERFTPIPDYIANLRRFVSMARKHGALPVIITPVTRRAFKDGHVPRSFPLYEDAAKQVAAETKTPLIDLSLLSRGWVERAGEDGSRGYYLHATAADNWPGFPKGVDDDVHFSKAGAEGVAALVAGGLKRTRLPVAETIRRRPLCR
ncbi:rhamnogalacturonan acetylesterase [Sphingomonas mollis]|uniref:Rhamnogalacturonan acetylesterase n=1 Tax=Sphingomonas mollis TaxID=2795726 RepID=A0ABS0XKH9_9SPHN|nr:rhamnogalacturonan acetylesterase [Sphingomonas sp. BT553]MBJ6120534.1 rhamnogalacturonan acetylesterase [Sphingomonas sp. BT553]